MHRVDNFKCVPSKYQHVTRNNHNIFPTGELIHTGEIDTNKHKIYIDGTGRIWRELKWYHSIFHNPVKNIKLQYYHSDDPEMNNSIGSSEIIVAKSKIAHDKNNGTSKIHPIYIFNGSYNYRDFSKTSHTSHFFADVFPTVRYCSCVGK